MPAVTIVIPVYNRALMLAQALESLRTQSWRDFDVVICDNASEEDLAAVVARFDDLSIRYHRVEKQVTALENFAVGADLCQAEFLKFLCSDDLLLPNALADLVQALERAPEAALCLGGCVTFSVANDGTPHLGKVRRPPRKLPHRRPGSWMVPDGYFVEGGLSYSLTPTACLYRTASFREIGGINRSIAAIFDWELLVALSSRFAVEVVEHPVCAFREHPEQWTKTAVQHESFLRDTFWITSPANPTRDRLGIPPSQQLYWRHISAVSYFSANLRTLLTPARGRAILQKARSLMSLSQLVIALAQAVLFAPGRKLHWLLRGRNAARTSTVTQDLDPVYSKTIRSILNGHVTL